MTYRAYPYATATGYLGYGWRFSGARSVLAATSDRAGLGGNASQQSHVRPEKRL